MAYDHQYISIRTADMVKIQNIIESLKNVFDLEVDEVRYSGWVALPDGMPLCYSNSVTAICASSKTFFATYARSLEDTSKIGRTVTICSHLEFGSEKPKPPLWTIKVNGSEEIKFL